MNDLIKAFTTYAGPDTDAQRKQYQRMLDLTRSAANACTGLYDDQLKDPEKKKLFVDLHLAELKALVYSNDRIGIKAKYCRFETAIAHYRNSQCCKEKSRENVLVTETGLLKGIHKLETESRLGTLRCIDMLLIGIILVLLFVLWLITRLTNWLPQSIENILPDVLKDQGWLVPVLVLVFLLLLVKRAWMTWRRRDNTKDDNLDPSKQETRPSVDGDSSA